jgi:hypothetical protein
VTPGHFVYNRHAQRLVNDIGVFGGTVCGLIAAANPATLLSAVVFFSVCEIKHVSGPLRWLITAASTLIFLAGRVVVQPLWPWRLWSPTSQLLGDIGIPRQHFGLPVFESVVMEILFGPLLVLIAHASLTATRIGVMGSLRAEQRWNRERLRAIRGAVTSEVWRARQQPDSIRLGMDRESRRPFVLKSEELMQHVFLPGASGSGKTTTIATLGHAVTTIGFGVVIVDCKGGGGLRHAAQGLATRFKRPLHIVDVTDPESVGYNVCTGDAADISNKLVGMFSFGSGGAEFYRLVSMMVIPLLIRAMEKAGETVTLASLTEALIPGRLRQIAHRAGEPYARELTALIEDRNAISDGIAGLRVRLSALLNGKFQPLLRAGDEGRPVLDWELALATPNVVYINLPATAASEDVELLGRVVAQDLKQQCAKRITAIRSGQSLAPALVVFDEFAALKEAEQIVDYLLQAREAHLPTVVSTQYIPETLSIRQAVLQSGIIIAHRVEAGDAEVIAAQFGTRVRWEASLQIDQLAGPTGLATAREQNAYRVNPNELRELRRGYAAVRSVFRSEPAIVQIDCVDGGSAASATDKHRHDPWWQRVLSGVHSK